MINKIVQKKIARTNISNNITRKLSIQFSLDGFSFCISNQDNTPLVYAQTSFETSKTPQELLSELQQAFETHTELQVDFASIEVIHQNNLATVVPQEYFKEDSLADYLKFTVKQIATDLVVFDELTSIDAKTVYIPYVNVNNYLFQHFGSFEYKHHATVLIDKLHRLKKEDHNIFIHFGTSFFDILVFDKQSLTLYNTFEYQSKEDVVYYVLFTLEQLQLDPNKDWVMLLGEISPTSDIYSALYTYIRNIGFMTPILTNADDTIAPHENFLLLA